MSPLLYPLLLQVDPYVVATERQYVRLGCGDELDFCWAIHECDADCRVNARAYLADDCYAEFTQKSGQEVTESARALTVTTHVSRC